MRVFGHFGELLQGRLGQGGPLALVTLPCLAHWAEVEVLGDGPFRLDDPGRVIGQRRAADLFARAGLPLTGQYRLSVTMPPGGGAGASTAGLIALARAAGLVDRDLIARAVLAVEGASDPLLFDAPERVLWASREGRVLGNLSALPRFEVLGGFLGPGQRTDPADMDFPDISDLVAAWPAAAGDLARMADLASESARRTLAHRGPSDDPTADLAQRSGALGFVIAHTGSARGLIFAPGSVPENLAHDLRRAGFSRITRFQAGGAAPDQER